MKTITVRRQENRKTFGVFYGEQLIEGGFVERQHAFDVAQDLREDWAREAAEDSHDVYDNMSASDRAYNVPHVQTDAGRSLCERRDCTVRALAIAAEIPYADAHAALELAGRKHGQGARMVEALAKLQPLFNIETIFPSYDTRTLGRFVKEFPNGRYLCRISRHCFAVVDGVVHDLAILGSRVRITNVWRVSPL
jgi:hypothetical protein